MTGASKMEVLLLPHLDAAYNLARWLMKNEQDAKDVVQESYIRAFRFFNTWKGESDAKPWLLKIVRNGCYTALQGNQNRQDSVEYDDDLHGDQHPSADPETFLLQKFDQAAVRSALESLPTAFREALILCELEGLSYKEIAEVTGVAAGTIMSRISRARSKLKELISQMRDAEDPK
jgi:RNA polymerase sigma-70 factor (ECF subfamily)